MRPQTGTNKPQHGNQGLSWMPARTRETCDTGRFKNRGQRKKYSEGIWKEPENGVEKKEPQKPNDSNGFQGSNPGGEYEIP